jgi:hypothetical protein
MQAMAASAMKRGIVGVGALVHAMFVTIAWAAAMYWDVRIVSGIAWIVVAWLWLAWPLLLFAMNAQSSRLTLAAVVTGALLLVPTAPEVYAFTVWSIRGFVP